MYPIESLLRRLGIKTKNKHYYIEALTHNSYKNENRNINYTYQRLEFLGDVIISKIISCYLFYKKLDEQEMTEVRKMLVSSATLKRASDELDLINYAFLGKGVNIETDTAKIREDIFESLMGAIYLDLGEIKVYEILKSTLIKYYESNRLNNVIDYKSKIQEIFQSGIATDKKVKNKILYFHTKLENKKFKSTLSFNNVIYGVGIGNTKHEADINAARMAYEKYQK